MSIGFKVNNRSLHVAAGKVVGGYVSDLPVAVSLEQSRTVSRKTYCQASRSPKEQTTRMVVFRCVMAI